MANPYARELSKPASAEGNRFPSHPPGCSSALELLKRKYLRYQRREAHNLVPTDNSGEILCFLVFGLKMYLIITLHGKEKGGVQGCFIAGE
jgi:hypothetical protein